MSKSFSLAVAGCVAGMALALGSSAAHARDQVNWSVTIGTPGYYYPPPAAYSPPPVIYGYPPVAYVQPAPVYQVAPPVVYYGYPGGGYRDRGWERHSSHRRHEWNRGGHEDRWHNGGGRGRHDGYRR